MWDRFNTGHGHLDPHIPTPTTYRPIRPVPPLFLVLYTEKSIDDPLFCHLPQEVLHTPEGQVYTKIFQLPFTPTRKILPIRDKKNFPSKKKLFFIQLSRGKNFLLYNFVYQF